MTETTPVPHVLSNMKLINYPDNNFWIALGQRGQYYWCVRSAPVKHRDQVNCKVTTYHSAQTLTCAQFIDLRHILSSWEYPHEGAAIQYNNAKITHALTNHYSNLKW